jgi:UDP-3-O-[3-hydroxymyristoyl] glucosamine N-acyltransferase
MEFTAQQIAMWLDGVLVGEPQAIVNKLNKIEEGEPGGLSFLSNPKYNQYLYTTQSSVVIINKSFVPEKPVKATLIKVEDAYTAFAKILQQYDNARRASKKGISPQAFIDPTAKIGQDVYIGEFAYIGPGAIVGDGAKIYQQCYVGDQVKIGKNTYLYPGVKIMHECIIGNECTLHAGVVIGADGFGFAPQFEDDFRKVPQIGNVIIEDRVDVGANTTIDRATMGSTIIRRGVKLDNLVQIAHNVEIGENTVMASMAGVSGSTKIGKNCMFGGKVGVAGHLEVADGVKIGAMSGIASSILTPNSVESGVPSFTHKSFLQSSVYFRKLPGMAAQIKELEKRIAQLTAEK